MKITNEQLNEAFREKIHADYVRETEEILPSYIFYRAVGRNKKECWCTACRCGFYADGIENSHIAYAKAGKDVSCPECRKIGQLFPAGKFQKKTKKTNIVYDKEWNGALLLSCCRVDSFFVKDEWNGLNEYRTDYTVNEVARYCLAEGDAVKLIRDRISGRWKRASEAVKEPSFYGTGMFQIPDNSYTVIGGENLQKTFLARFCADEFEKSYRDEFYAPVIKYLSFCAKHPNAEYLIHGGFKELFFGLLDRDYYGNERYANLRKNLKWKQNDLRKILSLNAEEIKVLSGCDCDEYELYLGFRKIPFRGSFERRMELFRKYGRDTGQIRQICELAELSPDKVINYIEKEKCTFREWIDYLRDCERLEYDLRDTAISKPKGFAEKHLRTNLLVEAKGSEIMNKKYLKSISQRQALEFYAGDYIIVLPKNITEIIAEGKILHHCVGGYAERHANSKLTIMFLRKKDEPETPFYTIEVSNEYKIVQCRGKYNNAVCLGGEEKPEEILEVEEKYQKYLDELKMQKSLRVRVSA